MSELLQRPFKEPIRLSNIGSTVDHNHDLDTVCLTTGACLFIQCNPLSTLIEYELQVQYEVQRDLKPCNASQIDSVEFQIHFSYQELLERLRILLKAEPPFRLLVLNDASLHSSYDRMKHTSRSSAIALRCFCHSK